MAGALVYAPGERLAHLRATFFDGPRSRDRTPISLERQADVDPALPGMVETARWRIGGPVLVIHGDRHRFTIDTPFHAPSGALFEDVFRLVVPGDRDIRAVEVRIDLRAPTVFAIAPFGPRP